MKWKREPLKRLRRKMVWPDLSPSLPQTFREGVKKDSLHLLSEDFFECTLPFALNYCDVDVRGSAFWLRPVFFTAQKNGWSVSFPLTYMGLYSREKAIKSKSRRCYVKPASVSHRFSFTNHWEISQKINLPDRVLSFMQRSLHAYAFSGRRSRWSKSGGKKFSVSVNDLILPCLFFVGRH